MSDYNRTLHDALQAQNYESRVDELLRNAIDAAMPYIVELVEYICDQQLSRQKGE